MGRCLLIGAAVAVASSTLVPASAGELDAADPVHDVAATGLQEIGWSGTSTVETVRFRELESPGHWLPPEATRQSRIVGGGLVEIDRHRYAAKVFVMDGPFSAAECTGVIVHPQWLLTAAHCTEVERSPGSFVDPTEFLIVAGTADWTDYAADPDAHLRVASEIVRHPDYDRSAMVDDLALVRVEVPFDMTVADAVPLLEHVDVVDGQPAHVVGWGAVTTGTAPVERLSGTGTVIDASCGVWPQEAPPWDHESRLCASSGADTGFCHGDSGGPLVVNRGGVAMLAGIVSFNASTGCGAGPDLPDVYARIAPRVGWIEDVTGPLWVEGSVSGTRAALPWSRPGHTYVVQFFDADETLLHTTTVTMPEPMILGPGDIGPDCTGSIAHPFDDVSAASYASSAVGCLWRLGITTGTGAAAFSPDRSVTRRELAAFAARLIEVATGMPCRGEHPFVDVSGQDYAADAIGCLASLGITTGTAPDTFSPDRPATRDQAAAFLARLYRALTGTECDGPPPFTDVAPTSFAGADIGCIAALGVTTGVTASTYAPGRVVDRAQAAAFFVRLHAVLTG